MGRIAPTAAVARAMVAQLRNLEDSLLKDIVMEGIMTADSKERTGRRNPVRTWMQLLKEGVL